MSFKIAPPASPVQPNIFEAPPLTLFQSEDGKEITFRGGGIKNIIVNISFHEPEGRAWLLDPKYVLEGMKNFKIIGSLSI